jgi:hypothetical protein
VVKNKIGAKQDSSVVVSMDEANTPGGANTILAGLVNRLVATYSPNRIYLLGSHARQEAGPDSDYDLMVVVPDDAPEEKRRSCRYHRMASLPI